MKKFIKNNPLLTGMLFGLITMGTYVSWVHYGEHTCDHNFMLCSPLNPWCDDYRWFESFRD